MSGLSLDELGWLLGLTSVQRRKRERSLEKMQPKPGQADSDFELFRQNVEQSLRWARSVEDHLILLLGNSHEGLHRLRAAQRDRYEELRTLPSA